MAFQRRPSTNAPRPVPSRQLRMTLGASSGEVRFSFLLKPQLLLFPKVQALQKATGGIRLPATTLSPGLRMYGVMTAISSMRRVTVPRSSIMVVASRPRTSSEQTSIGRGGSPGAGTESVETFRHLMYGTHNHHQQKPQGRSQASIMHAGARG